MSPKDMKTLSDDIDNLLRSFVGILEPNNDIRDVRFQQEVGRRWPPKSSCQENVFPNSNDFSLNSQVCHYFFTEVEQSVPQVIPKCFSNPTYGWLNNKKLVNINLNGPHGRWCQRTTERRPLTKRGRGENRILINICDRRHVIPLVFFGIWIFLLLWS